MDFKKFHKTRQKSLNFIHEHKVPLVLLLIIVMYCFLYQSNTQIHSKQKIKYRQKKISSFSHQVNSAFSSLVLEQY
jgi:hypothetical protein